MSLQLPIFPIVKKDLTFIELGNDTRVDGLVNFEKMRMIAKEVRHIVGLASSQYVSNSEIMHCGILISMPNYQDHW